MENKNVDNEIRNFIEYAYSDDMDRQKIFNVLKDYMEEVHQNTEIMDTKEFIDNEIRVVVQDIENISKIVSVQSNEFDGDHQREMTLLWNISVLKEKIEELKELIELKSNNK